MCGIFGIIASKEFLKSNATKIYISKLLDLSETRGKDSSGIAITDNESISVLKRSFRARKLYQSKEYNQLLNSYLAELKCNVAIMGHSRMVTNGSFENHNNNQPVVKLNNVVIHNGIIVNESELRQKYTNFKKKYEVDTEIISDLFSFFNSRGKTNYESIINIYKEIKGAASIAIMPNNCNNIFLASNTGSLYVGINKDKGLISFASEENMLIKTFVENNLMQKENISQINNDNFVCINIDDISLEFFNSKNYNNNNNKLIINKTITDKYNKIIQNSNIEIVANKSYEHLLQNKEEKINSLKRCTKCLLPETFPGITYDNNGVCSICNNTKPIEYFGIDKLKELCFKYKNQNNKIDVLVPLSGGRDSCYALHYLVKDLRMKPITYTYDWGMVTDLARRNISRITSQLNIEHILISANIKKKRENIKKNVLAWLNKPSLGTIPLFMAGDKQFFYYANQLQKQFNVDLLMFGMNPLERTDFKVAFTGVNEKKKQDRHYQMSQIDKFKISLYYAKKFLTNPKYINSSLIDTFGGFWSYYFIPHNYKIFFEYFPWNEKTINDTIINQYDWETSPDTPTTWRIGDGTAAFYNYIYYTLAGFTENDTFRSNQIRQGLISREEAMKCVINENKPRYESIKWYCDTININFEETIKRINKIKKLYS